MGRPIETARKRARRDLAHALHASVHTASTPADLRAAMAMTGKARAIRAAIDAGLLPPTMGEVAEMLTAGALAIRELDALQGATATIRRTAVSAVEAYATTKQLADLDGRSGWWRPRAPICEDPAAPLEDLPRDPDTSEEVDDGSCKVHTPAEWADEDPEQNPHGVQWFTVGDARVSASDFLTLSLRECAGTYGVTPGALMVAARQNGLSRRGDA